MRIAVPPNATGLVYLPGINPNRVVESGTRRERRAKRAPACRWSPCGTVLRVPSGDYEFRVRS